MQLSGCDRNIDFFFFYFTKYQLLVVILEYFVNLGRYPKVFMNIHE